MKLRCLYSRLGYPKGRPQKREREKERDDQEELEKQTAERELSIASKPTSNMPSPAFTSNMQAPTPMNSYAREFGHSALR